MTVTIFRTLSAKEEKEFRKWVQDNYVPFSEIPSIWHPVIRDECTKMNHQALTPASV